MKKTVIIGASNNPHRYAYRAAELLKQHNHEILPVGIKKGKTAGEEIINLKDRPQFNEVDTVTLYLNPNNQKEWEHYILSLAPKRIIFNPGTNNPSLIAKAEDKGIETLDACTLVMLHTGTY
jgi:hypothetical protein